MERRFLLLLVVLAAVGCTGPQFVRPYDEIIDTGLKEYKESINTFAKNMGDLAGTETGSYEKNKQQYNALESKIDLLIDRASIQSAGKGCTLSIEIADQVTEIMGINAPVGMHAKGEGDATGCTKRLLVLIKEQLTLLETIHARTDRCERIDMPQSEGAGPQTVSCLRPATSQTAMKITNQSINAAWVVETAKKTK